jgi:hypothetical protein
MRPSRSAQRHVLSGSLSVDSAHGSSLYTGVVTLRYGHRGTFRGKLDKATRFSVAYELRMSGIVGISWCRITRAEPVTTIADEVSPLDELFFSLDGSTVATADEQWRVEVSGIHFGHDGRWLQLNLCGDVNYSVTLKIDTVDVRAIHDNLAACLAVAPPPASSLAF